jgi:hypothetical protein
LPRTIALPRLARPVDGPRPGAPLAGLTVVGVMALLGWLACELAPAVPETWRAFRLRLQGATATATITDSWATRHGAKTRYHVRYEFVPGPAGSGPVEGEDSLEPGQSSRIGESVALGQVRVRYLRSDPSVNAVDDAVSEKDARRWLSALLFAAVLGLLAFLLGVVARSVYRQQRDRPGRAATG